MDSNAKKKTENVSLSAYQDEGEGDVSELLLKQNYSPLTILSMAAVLMATWEALSSTMVSGLVSGGPVSLFYGFIVAFIGSVSTAASLGEMTSMYPTAGGQYHFIAKLAPTGWQYVLSWFTGWIGTFGWVAFTASAPFLAATMVQGLITLNVESYISHRWHGTLIYWALLLASSGMNIWGTRLMALVENASLIIHVVAFAVIFVVMWVCSPSKHTTSFVFTLFQNNSGWESDGVSWSIGMLSSCYVLAGYDGAIHLCEEMRTPEISVPWCMLGSLGINGILGFAFLLAILFCMGDMDAALNSTTGFPIIEIFHSITGSSAAATAMTCTLILTAGLATIPLMASTSRMLWCLARDKAFPFSNLLSRVSERDRVPIWSVAVVSAFLVILGLVNIGSTTAFNAILSLAVFGLHISYLLPVGFMLWRRLCTPEVLSYGPWRLKGFGVIANTISVVYLCFTCIFMLFPSYQPVTAMNMNYASLIFGAVLIFSLIYWAWKGRKVYKGPIMENSL